MMLFMLTISQKLGLCMQHILQIQPWIRHHSWSILPWSSLHLLFSRGRILVTWFICLKYLTYLCFSLFLVRFARRIFQPLQEGTVCKANECHSYQHLLESKVLDESSTESRSHCEANTECHISDSIDSTIHCAVSQVDQVTKLWHHGAVHHSNGEAETSHGDDQLTGLGGHGNLRRRKSKVMLHYVRR